MGIYAGRISKAQSRGPAGRASQQVAINVRTARISASVWMRENRKDSA
jgi:hypothetical protein